MVARTRYRATEYCDDCSCLLGRAREEDDRLLCELCQQARRASLLILKYIYNCIEIKIFKMYHPLTTLYHKAG